MCPCYLPGPPQVAPSLGSPGFVRLSAAHLTALRLKAVGDGLQDATAARRQAVGSRCPGAGLATSLALLLAALAWLSRQGGSSV